MKELYLDCGMGAAGDMLTAALLELTDDPEDCLEELNLIGIPGVEYILEKSTKCGITGSHIRVMTDEGEEGEHACERNGCSCGENISSEQMASDANQHFENAHANEENCCEHGNAEPCHNGHGNEEGHHCHHGESGHEHGSHHSMTLAKISYQLGMMAVSPKVRTKIMAIYSKLARAESEVHGVPVDQIHFHELGTKDALADITAVCFLMERLGWPRVTVSPICTGYGSVHCVHGILPVPAPATAILLKKALIYGGDIEGELCTPTGAALLNEFTDNYGSMPAMKIEKIGYGMGKKDFPKMNGVRAVLGETFEKKTDEETEENKQAPSTEKDEHLKTTESDNAHKNSSNTVTESSIYDESHKTDVILEMQCNIDDMTAEEIGFATDRLYEGGALEVFTTPVYMKKSRPGTLLTLLCHEEEKDKMALLIFKYTETLGVRMVRKERCILNRREETVKTENGSVRRKISEGWGVHRVKYEYDDLAKAAILAGTNLRDIKINTSN